MPEVVGASNGTWSIARVLSWATEDFRKKGLESPRLDAEVLLAHVLGVDRIRLIVDSKKPLSSGELAAYRQMIQRRRRSEPIAYIVGEREFYGHRFHVDSRALIPRPDTETLVEVAAARTADRAQYGRALDLCTGSGCVAIAFAKLRPTWKVTGTDRSAEAIDLARENGLRLGAIWGLRWLVGDGYAAIDATEVFDLITANPPYIPTAEYVVLPDGIRGFEPREALDGGEDGLDLARRIIDDAPARLVAGGTLALEVMAGQAPAVIDRFTTAGFADVRVEKDYGGIERVVSGRKP